MIAWAGATQALCQPTVGSGAAESLPPPLPLDASGKPVAAPKSNLERPEFCRAIYVDALGPTFKTPAAIRKLVQDCRELGFDTIVAQVRSYGDAYYQSQIVPKAAELAADFDPLKTLVEEAHSGAPRLKVYAMVSALRVALKEQPLAPRHVLQQHRDWLTKTIDGTEEVGDAKNEYWLDPGVVAVQDHIALVAAEIARQYPVDGIQLERVRYPDVSLRTGYNPQALARFKSEKGGSDKPDPKDPAWVEWRRQQVTQLVRKTREAVKAARTDVDFSVAAITYGTPPTSREDFLQRSTPGAYALCDWQGWAEQGLADSVALMDYKAAETRAGDYEGWMNFALANKGKARVIVVVGGWLNSAKITAAMMMLPIFDPRADGVGLYSYHQPAAAPETVEVAFSVIKAVLRKENVERRASQLAEVLTKPLSTDHAVALGRLNRIADILSGSASGAGGPGAGVAGLPPLTSTPAASAATSALPPLSSTAGGPEAPRMPVLGQVTPETLSAGTAAPGATSLPPLSSAEAGTAKPAAAGAALPPLSAAPASAPGAEKPAAGLTNLSPPPSSTALPPLGSAPPVSSQGLPPLGATAGAAPAESSAPPPLPSLTPAGGAAPGAQPLSGAPTGQLSTLPPLGQTEERELPIAAPPAGAAQTPALPALATESVPVGSPAASPPPLPSTPAPDLSEKFAKMGIPTEETRGSVTIPGSAGETNFSSTSMQTPASPVPTFVAPSVVTTPPAGPKTRPLDVMSLMPAPAPIDRSNTAESPFIKTTPTPTIQRYVPMASSETRATPSSMSGSEVIVLKNGNQFVGQVLERGSTWRIQLPNGSKIALPASKIAGTRPMTTEASNQ